MKTLLSHTKIMALAAVAPFASIATAAPAPAPLYEANFNETAVPGMWLGGGATAGVTPGVSGLPGDYAFNNTTNGMGTLAPSNASRGIIQNSDSLFTGLQSFTVTGWYKANTLPGASARMLEAGNVTILFQDNGPGNTTFRVVVRSDSTSNVIAENTVQGDPAFINTDWTFFAITFDGAFVNFYGGSTENDVALIGSPVAMSLADGSIAAVATPINPVLGNSNSSNRRPFDGLMDNFRIYGSDADGSGALSLGDLQALRSGDLAPIPESSTIALIGGIACAGVVLAFRRRRSYAAR